MPRVNIYNPEGEIVGEKLLSEVQENGDLHKIVSIFILNSRNQLLMLRRVKDNENDKKVWDVVTDYVSGDVSNEKVAQIAILKDLKILALEKSLKFIDTIVRSQEEGDDYNQLNDVYLFKLEEFPPGEINTAQIIDVKGFPIHDIFDSEEREIIPRREAYQKVIEYLEEKSKEKAV